LLSSEEFSWISPVLWLTNNKSAVLPDKNLNNVISIIYEAKTALLQED